MVELDLGCVRAFVILHAEGQFARAAGVLCLSASALSKRIRRLESQLDTELVQRDTSGVIAFTPAGTRFVPHAQALLEDASRARRSVAETNMPIFRVGVPGRVGDHPQSETLARLAHHLRKDSPSAILRCLGVPFAQLTDALLRGTVDAIWDCSILPDPRIDMIELDEFERIGIVTSAHSWADSGEIDVGVFADTPMIYSPQVPSTWMARWYLDDVRPVASARLIEMVAADAADVMRVLATTSAVTVAQASMGTKLPPHLAAIKLVGVPRTRSYASSRRGDTRENVLRLLSGMQEVAAV